MKAKKTVKAVARIALVCGVAMAASAGRSAERHFVKGVHYLDRTLVLTAADSGSVLTGEPGAVLSGGRVLTGWRKEADGTWSANTWADWQKTGQDVHSVYADPLFRDAAAHDYALRPDSPALKLGFRPIDVSTIGPRPRKSRD